MSLDDEKERFVFFWQTGSPFSQWHPSPIEADGHRFSCAEQYMMYKKAELFGDEKVMAKVLKAKTPKEMKALGRQVRHFKEGTWKRMRSKIVYDASILKFTQNPHLAAALKKTKGATLVEASPYDQIWGIGLRANDPRAQDRSTWKGLNLLGHILTQVRRDRFEPV